MIPNNTGTFDDDIAAVLKEGTLVVSFQRACDALRDRRLEFSQRAVLAELLECMNRDTGTAWPSRQTIAERIGAPVKTVMNALYALKRLGYIDWERRPLNPGERSLTQYVVPAARFDRESLQLEITKAITELRQQKSARPAGQSEVPGPPGMPAIPGKNTARPAGYARPIRQESARNTGQNTARSAGQQEPTKELTKEEKEYGPNEGSDLPLQLPDIQSADAPKKPRKNSAPNYTEAFELFWKAYPDRRNNSKPNAFEQFRKLSDEDQTRAKDSLPHYAAYLRSKPDTPCVHAERYLKWRRFDGYLEPQVSSSGGDAWWQDPKKLAAMTLDRWRIGISKFANGIWHVQELGPPPGDPKCIVPRALIDELRLTELYNEHGIARGKH